MQYPNSLEPYQVDLLELAKLAGINIKPQILRILMEMLSMNIHPNSIHILLREICSRRGSARTSHVSAKTKSSTRKSRGAEKVGDGKSKT